MTSVQFMSPITNINIEQEKALARYYKDTTIWSSIGGVWDFSFSQLIVLKLILSYWIWAWFARLFYVNIIVCKVHQYESCLPYSSYLSGVASLVLGIVHDCPGALTHWVMHTCVNNLAIIGSHNGLLPGWQQPIICTNAEILLLRPLGTKANDMLIGINTFSFVKKHVKMLSMKLRPFCVSLNVLMK